MIQTAADKLDVTDFGRRLAMRQDIEVLGSVGAAARTAPTVGKAIGTLQRYLRAYTPGVVPELVPAGPDTMLFHLVRAVELPYHPQAIEVGIGLSLRVVRVLIGSGWHPVGVDFAHQPLGDPDDYRRHYEAPVRFGQPVTGFRLRAADLARPLSGDVETHEALVRHLQAVAPHSPQSTVPMVNDLIRRLLPGGNVELATVADQLGLHPRTLHGGSRTRASRSPSSSRTYAGGLPRTTCATRTCLSGTSRRCSATWSRARSHARAGDGSG